MLLSGFLLHLVSRIQTGKASGPLHAPGGLHLVGRRLGPGDALRQGSRCTGTLVHGVGTREEHGWAAGECLQEHIKELRRAEAIDVLMHWRPLTIETLGQDYEHSGPGGA